MFVKEKIRRLQKPVRRNEKYKKRVNTIILWMEDSNKIEMSENESSFSACKGHGFMDKASEKGYNQTRERAE